MPLVWKQLEAHQIANAIHQSHDLGSQAAARASNRLTTSPSLAPAPC
jgi:hypothetical protein